MDEKEGWKESKGGKGKGSAGQETWDEGVKGTKGEYWVEWGKWEWKGKGVCRGEWCLLAEEVEEDEGLKGEKREGEIVSFFVFFE